MGPPFNVCSESFCDSEDMFATGLFDKREVANYMGIHNNDSAVSLWHLEVAS